jgi:hypothetical protein
MTAPGRAARRIPYQASAARLVWALSSRTPAAIAQAGTSATMRVSRRATAAPYSAADLADKIEA